MLMSSLLIRQHRKQKGAGSEFSLGSSTTSLVRLSMREVPQMSSNDK